MRLAPVAFSLVALASLAGCGGGSSNPPQAGWVVTMVQSDPQSCMIMDNTRQLGSVNNSKIVSTVTNGQPDTNLNMSVATVTCTVSGSSSFNVEATASAGPDSLQIAISGITSSASMSSPVQGTIAYESDATADNFYQGSCNFWFDSGMGVAVAPGRIWTEFSCDALQSGLSTCPISQGFVAFEDCLQQPAM